jgi:hypothetical protein
MSRHQSIKRYGSTGIYNRTANDFWAVGIPWQYRWRAVASTPSSCSTFGKRATGDRHSLWLGSSLTMGLGPHWL